MWYVGYILVAALIFRLASRKEFIIKSITNMNINYCLTLIKVAVYFRTMINIYSNVYYTVLFGLSIVNSHGNCINGP